MSDTIYVDAINSLTTGSTININNNNIIGLPSGSGEILTASSSGNMTWQPSISYLKTQSSSIQIDNNTPTIDNILITTDSLNASWQPISLEFKQSVRTASINNGTLASSFQNGATIDGVTLNTNDRILIRAQTDPTENGIYIVNPSGSPSRSLDFPSGDTILHSYVFVNEGTINAGTGFITYGGTIDTDPILWDIFTTDMSKNTTAFVNNSNEFINAINLGISHIKLGNGTYSFSQTITINTNNCLIEGNGIDITNIQCTSDLTSLFIINGNYITIKNITFNGTSNTFTQYIYILGSYFNLNNCTLTNIHSTYIINISGSHTTLHNITINNSNDDFNSCIYSLTTANYTRINNININITGSITHTLIYINASYFNIINSNLTGNNLTICIYLNNTASNTIINNNNLLNHYSTIQSISNGPTLINNNNISSKTNYISEKTILNNNFITALTSSSNEYVVNTTILNAATTNYGFINSNNYFVPLSTVPIGQTAKLLYITGPNYTSGSIHNNYATSITSTSPTLYPFSSGNSFPFKFINNYFPITMGNLAGDTNNVFPLSFTYNFVNLPFVLPQTFSINYRINGYTSPGGTGNYLIIATDSSTLFDNLTIYYGDKNGLLSQTIPQSFSGYIILRHSGIGTQIYSNKN